MSRIPYPDLSKVSPEKLEKIGYPARKPLNITRMALHAPDDLWRTHYTFKWAAIYATTLDPELKEILILRVAWLSRSEYEIHHHLSISANLGFTPEKQEALRTQDYGRLAPIERALAVFTDEVVLNVSPSDAALAALREHFDEPRIVEILILIGSYMATARMIAATGVEPDEEAVQGWSAAPTGEEA